MREYILQPFNYGDYKEPPRVQYLAFLFEGWEESIGPTFRLVSSIKLKWAICHTRDDEHPSATLMIYQKTSFISNCNHQLNGAFDLFPFLPGSSGEDSIYIFAYPLSYPNPTRAQQFLVGWARPSSPWVLAYLGPVALGSNSPRVLMCNWSWGHLSNSPWDTRPRSN